MVFTGLFRRTVLDGVGELVFCRILKSCDLASDPGDPGLVDVACQLSLARLCSELLVIPYVWQVILLLVLTGDIGGLVSRIIPGSTAPTGEVNFRSSTVPWLAVSLLKHFCSANLPQYRCRGGFCDAFCVT